MRSLRTRRKDSADAAREFVLHARRVQEDETWNRSRCINNVHGARVFDDPWQCRTSVVTKAPVYHLQDSLTITSFHHWQLGRRGHEGSPSRTAGSEKARSGLRWIRGIHKSALFQLFLNATRRPCPATPRHGTPLPRFRTIVLFAASPRPR